MKKFLVNSYKSSVAIVLATLVCSCELNESFDYQDSEFTSPDVDMSIPEFIDSIDQLSILSQALKITDLDDLLSSGTYTLIAPDNVAMSKFLAASAYGNLEDYPIDELRDFLGNHIVENERLLLFDPISQEPQTYPTLSGGTIDIWYNDDPSKTRYYRVFVNGIQISTQGWKPTNGVVHVTNRGVLN